MDRDLGDAAPYREIETDRWTRVGKARVLYLGPATRSLQQIAKLLRDTTHDVVYLNSFLDPAFTLRVLLLRRLRVTPAKPIVIAPRGEFSPGAWSLRRWKKEPYLQLLRAFGALRGVYWQASTLLERDDIIRAIRIKDVDKQARSIFVASNLAPCPAVLSGARRHPLRSAGDPLRVCFLSRISPKKNLNYALRVLQSVRVPVRFSIYGPTEDQSHWDECLAVMKDLPPQVTAVHKGNVEPDRVIATLAEHDLFFLPTRGENFGHAIHEALSAGLPVLISDQTPWRQLEENEAGWALPLSDPMAFTRTIEEVFSWAPEFLAQWGRSAREHAAAVAENLEALKANRQLFLRLAGSIGDGTVSRCNTERSICRSQDSLE